MGILKTLTFQTFSTLRLSTVAAHLFIFSLYVLGAKLGLYIYITVHSSPALILPSIGIAFTAVYLGGYSLLFPIFVGQIVSLAGAQVAATTILVSAFSVLFQTSLGVYFLRRLDFSPQFTRTWDAGILVIVAVIVAAVGPAGNTLVQILTHTLKDSIFLTWSRAWIGGVFSIIILLPFFTSWYLGKRLRYSINQQIEIAAALAVLVAVDILVFWTSLASLLGITVIFVIPGALLWFVLRFHPRWLTLGLVVTTIVGITGIIVAHLSPTPVNIQLFSDEIYIGFIAALFLLFVVLVEERRLAFKRVEQNNEELAHALQRISAEDTAKTEFIAILAHELRNPLSPIVSALEWLRIQPQTEESIVAIESAQNHATMLRRLLDDLLDIVRVTQKKFKLNQELVHIKDMVSQSVESTAKFLQQRQHRIQIQYENENAIVFADPIRLKQILINILNNAGKYMDEGGSIKLTTKTEGSSLKIQVTDTGIGISPEILPNIFDPFQRVSPATSSSTGLGIGLSLTKQLVEMHDGTIEATSDGIGKGSVFTVRLPLPASRSMSRPTPVTQTRAPASSSRILIIDDNEAAAMGLQKLLQHHKHDVSVVFTGETGVRTVAQLQPEVVLLDIGLPDINGYEVARTLRAAGFKGTIIALTGYGQSGDKEESKQAGFDHHLVKPVSVADILSLLRETQNTESKK